MEVLCRVVEGGQILEPGSLMSSEMWWCKCIALNDAATRIRKFRRFCVHVKLAEVDRTFTAKDLGRSVINTCSTGSISGTGTGTGTGTGRSVPVPVPVPEYIQTFIGNRCYIGITHVGIQRMLFVFQHSSNVI